MGYLRGCLGLCTLILLTTMASSEQGVDKPTGDAKQPAKAPTAKAEPVKPPAAAKTLDMLNAPGAVLVICEEAKNALGLLPKLVVLTPEKYQELLDQIDTLKKQAKPARPDVPYSCKLSGQVDGDIVRLHVEYEMRTHNPRTQVSLGCQRAWPRSASLDGQLPLLMPGDDGLVVQIETPGAHKLTLELALPLLSRGPKGGERGIDMSLPRAPVTILESFTINSAVPEARLNGKTIKTKPVDGQHSRLEPPPLGQADHLDLSWKATAAQPPKGTTLLASDGRVQLRVDDTQVTTDVELNLQVLHGETKQWRIWLPPLLNLEVREPGIQDERIEGKDAPTAKEPWLTIRLKEPSSEPLRVVLQYTQPRKGNLVPVGPFALLDNAFRQRGTIVLVTPPEVRLLRHHRRGEIMINQRELTEDMRRDKASAAFAYWSLPNAANPAQPLAPLDFEVESVKGAVETRVDHTLTVSAASAQLATRIEVTPIRMGVDRIDLQVPADYNYDKDRGASPADLVEDVVVDAARQVAQIKLAKKLSEPFAVTLPAIYPLVAGKQQLALELPRPTQTLDRGGALTVLVAEGRELVAAESGADSLPAGTQRHTWRLDRAPASFDVAWRDYRPDLPVESTVDVTLTAALAHIHQRLDFHFPDLPPAQVTLEVPAGLTERIRVLQGGTLGGGGIVRLEHPDRHVTLVLSYTARPEGGARRDNAEEPQSLAIPLVRARQATRADIKVRIWSDPGVQLQLANLEAWDEQPIEAGERDSLPTLVARSGSLKASLTLVRQLAAAPPLAPVVIDRALMQVVVADGGYQNYRARFLVSRLSARQLDLEFPAPASSLNLAIVLDGKTPRSRTVDATGKDVDNGSIVRLEIQPELYSRPVVLDVRYQIAPGRTRGNNFLQSVFYPPVVQGDIFLGRVRWQVGMPSGWTFLFHNGGYSSEIRWDWRGGLLTPRSAVAATDLERWLGAPSADEPVQPDDSMTSLVCWRSELAPVQMIQVPQQGWLLSCSLVFLVVGLGLSFARMPRGLFWVCLALLAVAVAYTAIYWPSILPVVVYGCEPGIVVLLVVLFVYWMLQQHYRRQVVFLPGFTRLRAGTSIVRDGSHSRVRHEPSTIDAPRDSSLRK